MWCHVGTSHLLSDLFTLYKAEDMANSEKADLHLEYAFQDLMSMIRERIAV